jgi:hypothetical protein
MKASACLCLAVDNSKSVLERDIHPSRLAAMMHGLEVFIPYFKRKNPLSSIKLIKMQENAQLINLKGKVIKGINLQCLGDLQSKSDMKYVPRRKT